MTYHFLLASISVASIPLLTFCAGSHLQALPPPRVSHSSSHYSPLRLSLMASIAHCLFLRRPVSRSLLPPSSITAPPLLYFCLLLVHTAFFLSYFAFYPPSIPARHPGVLEISSAGPLSPLALWLPADSSPYQPRSPRITMYSLR